MGQLCRLFPDLSNVHVSVLLGWEAWPPASSGGEGEGWLEVVGGDLLLRNATNMKGAFRNVFL